MFKDRAEAGQKLAPKLQSYKGSKEAIVLGLARGGVVTAAALADCLDLPLDVVVVRKVGSPGNPELAIGAVTETGQGVFNDEIISALGVSPQFLKAEVDRQAKIAASRAALYRGKSKPAALKGKIGILVDDGVATGASMRAAIHAVKAQGVKKLVLAVPVGAPDSMRRLAQEVDQVVCLFQPTDFEAVGAFYDHFDQTSDDEVVTILKSR